MDTTDIKLAQEYQSAIDDMGADGWSDRAMNLPKNAQLKYWIDFAERAVQCITTLTEGLESLRQGHLIVDGDCWYSCPKAKNDYDSSWANCNDKVNHNHCDCGADEHNARIDALLKGEELGAAQ